MFLSPIVDSQFPRKYELHVFVGLAFSPHSASEKWAGGRVQGAGSLLHSWSVRKMLGQQLELGSWRPYGLCSFPRWWANSAVQVCTTGTSLSVKWHAMSAFAGLVSDTPEKHFQKLPIPILMELDTPWYNCLQIASKDILVLLDSCICLWIYPSARIACAEPKVWICDAMRPVTGQEVIQRTTWWSTESPLATDATGFFCPCFSWIAANFIHQNKHGKNPHFWLVVENMNFMTFHHIGHVIMPNCYSLHHFLEG